MLAGRSLAAFSRMAAFKHFTDITAWQQAHQLSLRVEIFVACPEFRRHFPSCAQLREAARSAPTSIADGHARLKRRDFAQLVRTAKAAEAAVLNHLIDAHRQRLITTDELIINRRLARRAMRTASALIRYLESTADSTNKDGSTEPERRAKQSPEIGIRPTDSVGPELHGEQRRHADDDRR